MYVTSGHEIVAFELTESYLIEEFLKLGKIIVFRFSVELRGKYSFL